MNGRDMALGAAATAFGPFVSDVVAMYFAMIDPKTSYVARALIATALMYLVSPLDAIPDTTPIVGHADDVTVIYMVLHGTHDQVTDEHIEQADAWLSGRPVPESRTERGMSPPPVIP